ncbi:MurR/RpiR family transcriptional regulator [Herbiconiux liangxiaofengii]|uniref:MurR/RpiR family transcriptional regulator n=1 Tax=Herbiconiux liangxiaofengii TaxID=3342795 RepID=UPI0035B7069B
MQWSDEVGPTTRIATVVNSLQPSERRVVELILGDPEGVVEITAQELADRAGVARSTVIRSCQTLGYRGYPQLRVALTRELAQSSVRTGAFSGSSAAGNDHGPGALGRLRSDLDALAAALPRVASVLTEAEVEDAVGRVVDAGRLVVVASGLSSPLALDLSLRLTAIGRPAEYIADPIGQQIAVSRLRPDDLVLVISGSGANELSLKAARAARTAGAGIVAITSFATSPIGALADVALVVAPANAGFRHEVEHTSRIPHVIVLESLVEIVADRLGPTATATRAEVLTILSDNLSD